MTRAFSNVTKPPPNFSVTLPPHPHKDRSRPESDEYLHPIDPVKPGGSKNRSGNSLPDPMVATGLEPVTPTM